MFVGIEAAGGVTSDFSDPVQAAEHIVHMAFRWGASDIHLDPCAEGFLVRFRVHGRLVDWSALGGAGSICGRGVAQRFKVLARMAAGDVRKPQDGQMRVMGRFGEGDLRVASIPTVNGERLAIRVLPQDSPWADLASLGLASVQLGIVREALGRGGGLVVVTGRIGSGKSTTMHALLRECKDRGDSVMTIEDPVERRISGYQQIEVDERTGLTFAQVLRGALRQDPDVLMIGEIRDAETAAIATRAGLTGHLIVTSLHAGDAEQVPLRLEELGVSRSYVSEALRLAIWQRLFALHCLSCQGQGCGECLSTGLIGRRAEFRLWQPVPADRAGTGTPYGTVGPAGISRVAERAWKRLAQAKRGDGHELEGDVESLGKSVDGPG